MRIIRLILGRLILLFNWVFTPRGVKRSPDMQAIINGKTSKLALYQYEACPFCVKVRREMKRQSLSIETRDVKRSDAAKAELLRAAATSKCLACALKTRPGKPGGCMNPGISLVTSRHYKVTPP